MRFPDRWTFLSIFVDCYKPPDRPDTRRPLPEHQLCLRNERILCPGVQGRISSARPVQIPDFPEGGRTTQVRPRTSDISNFEICYRLCLRPRGSAGSADGGSGSAPEKYRR